MPQSRPIVKAGVLDKMYGKWAENSEAITSPKFTANQINLAPTAAKKNLPNQMGRDGKSSNQRNAKYSGS